MRLSNPPFERALRDRVRAEVKRSKEGWAEYRRLRKVRASALRVAISKGICSLLSSCVGLFWLTYWPRGTPWFSLGFAIFGLGLAPLLAYALPSRFDDCRCVLGHQPISDSALARLALGRWIRSTVWFLWLSVVLCVALTLVRQGATVDSATAAALGALNWGVVLGISCALAAWRPGWASPVVGLALSVAGFCVFFLQFAFGRVQIEVAERVTAVLPTGWALHALRVGWEGGVVAMAAAAAVAALPFLAWRRAVAALEETPIDPPEPESPPTPADEPLRAAAFRETPPWLSAGPIERAFAATLSPRGLIVADFVFEGRVAWSKTWRLSALIAAAASLWALALVPAPAWTFWLPIAFVGLPMLGGAPHGIAPAPQGGRQIATFALYPVGIGEISRVFLRSGLVRIVAWAPLLLLLLAAAAPDLGTSVSGALATGAKGILVAVAMRPLSALSSFSMCMREALPMGVARVGLLALTVLALCATVAGGFMLFVVKWGLVAPGFALLLLPPFALLAIACRRIDRGRVDLMRNE